MTLSSRLASQHLLRRPLQVPGSEHSLNVGTGTAGRRSPATESLHTAGVRAATWTSAPLGFASLFVVGLVVRLLLAPHGGFPGDLLVFQHWEDLMANQDWSQFSDPRTFIYYPFLYVLWALGQVSRILHGTHSESIPFAVQVAGPRQFANLLQRRFESFPNGA
ncbi:MAG TPA: hypothetical protein VIN56_12300 [Candidatus Dormibacteraeota bacterium]